MTIWRERIDVASLLSQDKPSYSQAECAAIGAAIAKLFAQHAVDDFGLQDTLDALRDPEDQDEFNERLDELYDWADDHRIWLGR